MDNTKLIIGIPTLGMVDWRFSSSLTTLQCPPNTKIIWQVKTMIDTARNRIVELFLHEKADFLLMLDDDMLFPPESALKLLSHDVDIVSCLAFKRGPNYDPCIYRMEEKNKFRPILPQVFQEVDAVGAAGLLVKRKVFQKVKYPWFETGYDLEGKRFPKGNHFSVDFDFSVKATEAGFKIFCDPEVAFGHIGSSPVVNQDTFLEHIQKLNEKQKGTDNRSI